MVTTLLSLFLFVLASLSEAVLEAPLYLQRLDEKVWGTENADIFVVRVLVGNPASAFNLTLDLTYYESMLIGKGSTSEICSNSAHIGYDMSRSTTFRLSPTKPYTAELESYMAGRQCRQVIDATVTVGKDDFLGSKQVPFGVISQFKGSWNPDWPSDGILGLSGPNSEFAGQPGTARMLASNNGPPMVSWHLSEKRVVGARSGSIAFGGLPASCSGLNYATPYFTDKRQPWNFRVNGSSLGGVQNTNVGGKGFFDFARSILLELPADIFTAYMTEINAEKDQATGLYYVNCDSALILPPLTVQLDGVKLTFPYHAYIDLGGGQVYETGALPRQLTDAEKQGVQKYHEEQKTRKCGIGKCPSMPCLCEDCPNRPKDVVDVGNSTDTTDSTSDGFSAEPVFNATDVTPTELPFNVTSDERRAEWERLRFDA